MIVFIYIVGSIIACFFSWKKWSEPIKNNDYIEEVLGIKEFWIIMFFTLAYPITLPIYLFWQILELIYKRLNK